MNAPGPDPESGAHTNPFPGLRPFREGEEHLYFGREAQIDDMVDTLAGRHFLAVVGTSGSGKSSLINCGLIPALHRGLMSGAGSTWKIVVFRPGNRPIRALAEALARHGIAAPVPSDSPFSPADLVEAALRMSRLGLADAFENARLPPECNLLVVADQFEELFRYRNVSKRAPGGDALALAEAAAFVNLLLEPRLHAGYRLYTAITMRSDFLGDCAQFYGLPEAINRSQYLVPRLTRDERRLAIEGPIRVAGATITPTLLTQLVNDVGDNPDQLSLLQHALNRTWYYWSHRPGVPGPIDLPHYQAIGGMAQALDRHAEKAYGELPDDRARRLCEKIFRILTDRGTDARGIRRPTPLKTLSRICGAPVEDLAVVIDVFRKPSRSFLVPPLDEALEPDSVIDISHESLMRAWHRLDDWSAEEARLARNFRRAAETAQLYYDEGKAALLRDPELQTALDWMASAKPNAAWAECYGLDFERTARFVEESAQARAAEQAAHRSAEAAERNARHQTHVRKRWMIGGLVAVLAIFGLTVSVLLYRAVQAERQADEAKRRFEKVADELGNTVAELYRAKHDLMTEIPDVTGKSMKDAVRLLAEKGLTFQIENPAGVAQQRFVTRQNPQPNGTLRKGEPITLTLSPQRDDSDAAARKVEPIDAKIAMVTPDDRTAPSPGTPQSVPAEPVRRIRGLSGGAPSTAIGAARAPAPPMSAPAGGAAAPGSAARTPSVGSPSVVLADGTVANLCDARAEPWVEIGRIQDMAQRMTGESRYPAALEGRLDASGLRFRVAFGDDRDGTDWDVYLSRQAFEARSRKHASDGYRLACAQAFTDPAGEPRIQAVWSKGR